MNSFSISSGARQWLLRGWSRVLLFVGSSCTLSTRLACLCPCLAAIVLTLDPTRSSQWLTHVSSFRASAGNVLWRIRAQRCAVYLYISDLESTNIISLTLVPLKEAWWGASFPNIHFLNWRPEVSGPHTLVQEAVYTSSCSTFLPWRSKQQCNQTTALCLSLMKHLQALIRKSIVSNRLRQSQPFASYPSTKMTVPP